MPSIRDLIDDHDDEDDHHFDPTPEPQVRKSTPPPPPKQGGPMPGDLPSFKLDDNPLKTEKKRTFWRSKGRRQKPRPNWI